MSVTETSKFFLDETQRGVSRNVVKDLMFFFFLGGFKNKIFVAITTTLLRAIA